MKKKNHKAEIAAFLQFPSYKLLLYSRDLIKVNVTKMKWAVCEERIWQETHNIIEYTKKIAAYHNSN